MGAFLIVFFFSGTIIFFAAAVVAAFALANTFTVYYSLIDKLLAAFNTSIKTLTLGRG